MTLTAELSVADILHSRPAEGLLAIAPGAHADMTVLALVAGADRGFVILHHLTQMVVVILGAPVAARLVGVRHPPG